MQIITDPQQLQQQCLRWRADGIRTALVPTMGYYHAGHESLMRHARSVGDKLIVTLFVNPAQFGPEEDLEAYPRDLERDAAVAEACGADILYVPRPEEMYATDHATWVEVPLLAQTMCGITRPVHFRGVCTVVLKLFMLTMPSVAVFGEKDWQQLAIIRRMVRDLNVPVDIIGQAIVREDDGLALSSRNVYLTPEERAAAPHIHQSMRMAQGLLQAGEHTAESIKAAIRAYLHTNFPQAKEDYLVLVNPETLAPMDTVTRPVLCATAMYVGKARLIDNILL